MRYEPTLQDDILLGLYLNVGLYAYFLELFLFPFGSGYCKSQRKTRKDGIPHNPFVLFSFKLLK